MLLVVLPGTTHAHAGFTGSQHPNHSEGVRLILGASESHGESMNHSGAGLRMRGHILHEAPIIRPVPAIG